MLRKYYCFKKRAISDKKIIYGVSRGIALVEVIASMGIAVVVITSLLSLSLYTLRSSLASKLQLQATKVATRESELLRAYRDSLDTWEEFTAAVSGCVNSSCHMNLDASEVISGSVVDGVGLETVTRSFKVTAVDANTMRVTITAAWQIAGTTKSTHIYTDLTNWRKVF